MTSTEHMLNIEMTETEKWFLTEYYTNALQSEADSDPNSAYVHKEALHFLNHSYSPFNAFFSPLFKRFWGQGLKTLNEKQSSVWMLRDGIVPLVWFLDQLGPESVDGQILVHADFAPMVPKHWREKTLCYRVRSTDIIKPKSLFLAGAVTEKFLSLDELDKLLDRMESVLGRQMKDMKIDLFAPVRDQNDWYVASYFQLIFSRLKNVNVVHWGYLENMPSQRDVAYVDLNEGWLCKDTYVQQLALSRGAQLLFNPDLNPAAKRFALSPSHEIEISPISNELVAAGRDDRLLNFYASSAQNNESDNCFDWPNWHERWCRAAFSKIKSNV